MNALDDAAPTVAVGELEVEAPVESGSQEAIRKSNATWAALPIGVATYAFVFKVLRMEPGHALTLPVAVGGCFFVGRFVFGYLEVHSRVWDWSGWANKHRREAILEPLLAAIGDVVDDGAKKKILDDPRHYCDFLFQGAIDRSKGSMRRLVEHYYGALGYFRFSQILVLIALAWFVATTLVSVFFINSLLWVVVGGAILLGVGYLNVVLDRRLRFWTSNEVVWIQEHYPRVLLDLARQILTSLKPAEATRVHTPARAAVAPAAPESVPQRSGPLANNPFPQDFSSRVIEPSIDQIFSDEAIVNLRTPGHAEYVIARALLAAKHRVRLWDPVNLPDAWVFHLVPGFVLARERRVEIDLILYESERGRSSEAFRLLRGLGCNVVTSAHGATDPQGFSGAVVDPGEATALLVTLVPEVNPGSVGWMVEGKRVSGLVSELMRAGSPAQAHVEPQRDYEVQLPTFSTMPEAVLVNRLRRVPEYRSCDICVEEVDVRTTRPMSKSVKTSTEIQVSYLERLYEHAGLALFAPAKLSLTGGMFSPVIPPVLEQDENGYFRVHEGHTRLHRRYRRHSENGESPNVHAVVVRGCDPPPQQRQPFEWTDVGVVDDLDTDHEYIHTHNLESLARCRLDAMGKLRFDFMTPHELEMEG